MPGTSLRFEKRLNFSISPRKLSILYWSFSRRSEALIVPTNLRLWFVGILDDFGLEGRHTRYFRSLDDPPSNMLACKEGG